VSKPEHLLTVSSSPHVRAKENTRAIMLDVLIALLPALIFSIYFFGLRALLLCLVSVAACQLFELLYEKLMKKPVTIHDLSAAVTGLLLAFCLPVTTPYWVLLIGDFFAIVIVKQLYGGLGKNFMNPALAGRVFLFSIPTLQNKWAAPIRTTSIWDATDTVTSATPLATMHLGSIPYDVALYQLFIGQVGGSLGEVSACMLLLGGLFLLARRVISIRIPLSFIGTVALLTFLFPRGNDPLTWMLYQLLAGGLFLGAIFMATDYTTSPTTRGGQWIFGIGCGLITVFIRYFGAYPEGVSFSILIMNAFVWLIDRFTRPRRFGTPGFSLFRKGAGK
jgi:electron transport complex protein RnfD